MKRGLRGVYKGYIIGALRGYSFIVVQLVNDIFKKALGGNVLK
jgi:hypothetical protein